LIQSWIYKIFLSINDKYKASKKPKLRLKDAETSTNQLPNKSAVLSANDKLLHELQVHQIKLVMQGKELQRTHAELENAKQRYADLYDFSPVSYLTVSHEGVIIAANPGIDRINAVFRNAIKYRQVIKPSALRRDVGVELHLKVTHLESQNMAHLALGFLVLVSFVSFVVLCLKR
jgi:hypothetical protein